MLTREAKDLKVTWSWGLKGGLVFSSFKKRGTSFSKKAPLFEFTMSDWSPVDGFTMCDWSPVDVPNQGGRGKCPSRLAGALVSHHQEQIEEKEGKSSVSQRIGCKNALVHYNKLHWFAFDYMGCIELCDRAVVSIFCQPPFHKVGQIYHSLVHVCCCSFVIIFDDGDDFILVACNDDDDLTMTVSPGL